MLEGIVSKHLQKVLKKDNGPTPALLRIFFHDCLFKNPSLVHITITRGERERRENERSEGEEEGSKKGKKKGTSFVIDCEKGKRRFLENCSTTQPYSSSFFSASTPPFCNCNNQPPPTKIPSQFAFPNYNQAKELSKFSVKFFLHSSGHVATKFHYDQMIQQWLNIPSSDILIVLSQNGGSNRGGFNIVSSSAKSSIHLDGVFNIISYDLVPKLQNMLMTCNFKIYTDSIEAKIPCVLDYVGTVIEVSSVNIYYLLANDIVDDIIWFLEGMALVFYRSAWYCTWYLTQVIK
ncbi:hypothetical protein JHK82_012294 [Glycine max]|nr:hypothetical protein JHK85_012646 [Glycine max]KAG5057308.1 hypothetical protein JHK86_012304 [Glycine max]KAG5154325.1 hypothetical protein JHK82_012294 [Glycine max]